MTAWVVNRVPRPMVTPANAKSITGVNIAPPNLWIFCIIWNSPLMMAASPPFPARKLNLFVEAMFKHRARLSTNRRHMPVNGAPC